MNAANAAPNPFPTHSVRDRLGRVSQLTVELPFELLESKLGPPRTSGRDVRRTALVEQLNHATDTPIVMLCAGPGYGKTTALAQWALSREERPFAWVSLD